MKNYINFLKEVWVFVLIGLFIFCLLTFSLINSLERDYEAHYNFALFQAKENFEKDIIYRKWAALEGGVYVPITEFTPPNPYLNVPYRDVETKEGLKLTLVNPAYLTRMVHGLKLKQNGTISHITSLNPINPNNKPDNWEVQALKEIEKGNINEKYELTKFNGKDYFRYISLLKVEEPCLRCHAQQGYKVGDIRGGISVSIPFDKFNETIKSHNRNNIFTHLTAAFITLIFLFLGAKTYKNKNKKILDELNQFNFVINSANIGYWEFDLIKNELNFSENWLKSLEYDQIPIDKSPEYFLDKFSEEDKQKAFEILDKIKDNQLKEFSFEHRIRKANGDYLWVSTRGFISEYKNKKPVKIVGVQIDIDKDKKIVEKILNQVNILRTFIDISPIPFTIAELLSGKIIYVNDASAKTLGYSSDELIGRTSFELNIWNDIKDRQNITEKITKDKILSNLTSKFKRKDGKIIECLGTVAVIESDDKKYLVSSVIDITDQKKYERILKKEKELYSYFNYLHSSIDNMNEQDFYDLSIEYLVKLTDSKHGFFHRVSEDQKEIILTTWNKETKEFCKAESQTHYPIDQAGNWVDCLKTKKAIVYNDYKNSPNQKGLPIGHVQVEKFMSVATFVNEKPYLIFGVGNKEEDYDEIDAQLLENFANELSKIIEKKQYIIKIEDNERFVSTLIDNLPGFVYRCAYDKDRTMYYLSKQCKETTGYEPEELLNNSLLSYNDIILPEFQKEIWEKIQHCIKNDLPYELEYQIVKKDGNIIWVWERGRSVKDKNGNLLFLEGFITNIDIKKILEIELRKNEEKFRLIAENIGEVISVFNLNFEYIYISPSVEKLLGYTPEEIIQSGLEKLFENEYVEQFKTLLEIEIEKEKNPAIDKKRTVNILFQQRRKDGNLLWIEGTASFLRNKEQQPIGILIVTKDVTEKKKLEDLLTENEKKYRLLVEEMTQGLAVHEAVYDDNGNMIDYRFLDMNKSYEKILGIKKEDWIGKTVLEVLPKTEKYWIDTYAEVVKTGRAIEYENYSVEFDRYFHVVAYNNQPNQFAVIVTDITERKKIQKQLEQSETKLKLSQKYARIGHYDFDLKTGFWTNSEMLNEIFGIDEDYVRDVKGWLEIVHPEDREEMFNYLNDYVLNGKNKFDKEYRIIRKNDNKLLWVHGLGTIDFDEVGEPVKMFGTIQDITERVLTQKALIESEHKYKSLANSGSTLIWASDSDGLCYFFNDVWLSFTGRTIEQEIGNGWAEGVHPKDLDMCLSVFTNALRKKERFNMDYRLRYYDGSYRWIRDIGTPQYNTNGDFIGYIGHCYDINEQKIAEEKLIERERELNTIVNSSNIYVIKTDMEGKYTFVNNSFREKFSWIYGKDEIIGKNAMESIVPEDQQKALETVNKCIAQPHTPFGVEISKPLHNGKRLTSYWYFSCNLNQNGDPSEIICVGIDVTDRKKAEEEKARLLTAIEQSRVSVVITDINGNIEYVNNYFVEHSGYSKDEVLGRNPRMLSAGKHSKDFYKQLWTTVLSGNTWEGVFYNKKKNGQLYWEYAVITPVKDKSNRIINFVAVKEDITDKINKEQQLNEYKEKLEQLVEERTSELQKVNNELLQQIQKEKELELLLQESLLKEKEINELKTRFFASVSHEFRTPLTAVLTSAQMIQRYGKKWSEDKLEKHYQNIDKMINHLTKLLDDIMLISRTEREILKNNPKPEDINLLFNQIVEEHYPLLQKDRKINFHNHCSQNTYNIDSKLMKHIVGNLLNNSIKYGYKKTDIEFTVSEEKNYLIIQVEDKGIGIEEKDLKNIFEPFYRTQHSSGIKGTGLGLNIVKRCVDLLNGTIEVESKLNVGTKFTVRIPIKDINEEQNFIN